MSISQNVITSVFLFLLLMYLSTIQVYADESDSVQKNNIHNYNNNIELWVGGFRIFNSGRAGRPFSQVGGFYKRRVFKNLFLGIGYAQWSVLNVFAKQNDIVISEIAPDKPEHRTSVLGRLDYRTSYKMIDVFFYYSQNIWRKKQYLSIGAGGSYCWGYNSYLDWYVKDPGGYVDQAGYDVRVEGYTGAVVLLSYDYKFFNGWANIGLDLKGRYYAGRPKNQYDYGVHFGFNF